MKGAVHITHVNHAALKQDIFLFYLSIQNCHINLNLM